MSTSDLTADFLAACDRARAATTDGQRRVTRGAMIGKADALRDRVARLEADILAGSAYLAEHPDDPHYAHNDALVAAWTEELAEIEGALREGLTRWLGDTDAVTAAIASLDAATTKDLAAGASISERMRIWNDAVFANPKPKKEAIKSRALREREAA